MTSSPESTTEQIPPPAYFGSLTIENVKCFKGEQTIGLSDGHGKPALWTVILGNNNTGKTTLLRCLADLEPVEKKYTPSTNFNFDKKNSYTPTSDFNFNVEYEPRILNKSHTKFNYKIQCEWVFGKKKYDKATWSFEISGSVFSFTSSKNKVIGNIIIYGYGTSRRIGDASLSESEHQDNSASLFDNDVTLTNVEEWIIQSDYASKNGILSAKFRLEKIKNILTKGLLPDVKNFKCVSEETNGRINNFVEFETDYGWVKLRELGYGYQVTLAWVVDLAKKLFERYPNSENPLHEPAIVLIDELDLHLHPEWQRKIISFLSEQFRRTQFIATTHSPLIVQSAENINLVILEKQQDHVIIKQRPDIKTFKGWTVEEILTELMGMDDKTLSDDYLKFMHNFDEALDEDNYHKAKQAYDELDKILHPKSVQRKLLRIQMSSLVAE
jgi:predicted ATP-binding protein involved in virulence